MRQIYDRSVVQNIHILDDGILLPVAGQICQPVFQRFFCGCEMTGLPAQADGSGIISTHCAKYGLEKFCSSVS